MIDREDSISLLADVKGGFSPSPPRHAGRSKRVNSRSPGGGLPVTVGSKVDLSAVSKGVNR